MVAKTPEPLAVLYEADETAWLDAMAELIGDGRLGDLDYPHLREFLEDMAKRDRREVSSRLTILLAHVLKWTYQKKKRTRSGRATIVTQRQELQGDFSTSRTLRNHAEAVLGKAYANAVELAAAETGLDEATFPDECPWTMDQLLSPEVLAD